MSSITTHAAETRGASRSGVLGHNAAFWSVAFAFLITIAFGTVATPLYELYQLRDGFSTFMITVVFAVYAVGVVATLFFAGHLSDYLGRKRMILIGLLIEILSAVIFIASPALPSIIIGRVVSGIGVGLVSAAFTAFVGELNGRSGASRTRADVVGAAANFGGFAVGALVAGFLAEWVSAPLRTPFIVFGVLMIVGAIAVALSPETANVDGPRPAYRPQRVSLPAEAKPAFWAAASAGFVVFAVNALFNTIAPAFVAGTMGHPSRALAGTVAFIVFGTAALLQIITVKVAIRTLLIAGLTLAIVGLIVVTVGAFVPSLALFLIGGGLAGGGGGLLFKGAVTTVVRVSEPAKRGEALAGLFLSSYVGLIVPVLAVGIAVEYVQPKNALLVLSAVLILVCLAASPKLVGNQK
ncbi:MFS transporter [Actinoplanes sp. TBRC 11911]|uniref:MFS transporter n=1 Tax=Actinoplanes sp. TBRC 11911 TaxID=2729386 RepID=UPI00145FC8B4|nr:MFS transporter [Actinoplanes sp. TBRC 11911]NMO55135.1 MFS transporter [Actinoplanes sp. TBRC 11911]